MWRVKLVWRLNTKQHWSHSNLLLRMDFSDFKAVEWILLCTFNMDFVEKISPHWSQGYSFFWKWVNLWNFKFPKKGNDFPHSSQVNFFSLESVWVSLCAARYFSTAKLFWQISQTKGFFPEWPALCTFRLTAWRKNCPHSSQANGVCPEWINLWSTKWCFSLNDLSHLSILNACSHELLKQRTL